MEIYKILDRFELMYSDDSRIADLRRAYIDQDLHSIFKLSNADEDLRKAILEKNVYSIFRLTEDSGIRGSVEDLKKAVIHKNLYSIFRLMPDCFEDLKKAVCEDNIHSMFRLLENDNLRKLIINDNKWALFPLLKEYTNSQFVDALKIMFLENIEFDEDCFSRGQLQSKVWLVNELKKISVDLGVVFLCAGWYGTLATMIFESGLHCNKIRSFDIDERTEKIAEIFNRPWVIDDWKFKSVVQDIHDINFNEHSYIVSKTDGEFERLWDIPDTIINTSCEHIENFDKWYNSIPDGKLVILQSNNFYSVEEHVNCVKDIKEFGKMAPMTGPLFHGELDLGEYKRFMLIGYK